MPKTTRERPAALDAVDGYLSERAGRVFLPVAALPAGRRRAALGDRDRGALQAPFRHRRRRHGLRVPRRSGPDRQGVAARAPDAQEQRRGAGDGVLRRRWSRGRRERTHGALAGGDAAPSAAEDHDRHPGRPRSQPEEHLAGDPARRAGRRHRPVRLGQVEPGVRHDLRRGAAPLHGIAVDVRQAVRRAGRQARRRFRLRPLPGDLDRAEDDRQQSPLDRRHDDRHLELSQPAVRDDWRAPLPSHRRGRAQPHREPDPRSRAVASRRRRDRAAGADLQGLRRGPELRLHRGAEEGLSPADRRRHPASTSPTTSSAIRRPTRARATTATLPSATPPASTPSSIASSSGGSTRSRSRPALPAPCSSATGWCSCTSRRARRRAKPNASTAPTAARRERFIYGDIGPEFFQFNNPESACRTCGGLGVDKVTHPELLVPDPQRSILGGCFVREAFNYNPDTWNGRMMFSLAAALDFPLDSPWNRLPEKVRHAILYGIEPQRIPMLTPPDAKIKRGNWEGAGDRLQRHRAANRTLLPLVPAARRSQLENGGLARQGHGRADVPRLQGRTRCAPAGCSSRSPAGTFTTSGR